MNHFHSPVPTFSLPKPIAIFACDDLCGRHVLEACEQTGLAVPGEISVITITRGEEELMATPNIEFKAGDLVHLAVLASAVSRLESLLGV